MFRLNDDAVIQLNRLSIKDSDAIKRFMDALDDETRNLFLRLLSDKNSLKPDEYIGLLMKKNLIINKKIKQIFIENRNIAIDVLNHFSCDKEVIKLCHETIPGLFVFDDAREKLSKNVVYRLFEIGGYYNDLISNYPDIIAKILQYKDAKSLFEKLLTDHLKWSEINLDRLQVYYLVEYGFYKEVFSNYFLVKKLGPVYRSESKYLEVMALHANQFIDDEEIAKEISFHIENSWLGDNLKDKKEEISKLFLDSKTRKIFLNGIRKNEIIFLCQEHPDIIDVIFSERKDPIVRFEEVFKELSLVDKKVAYGLVTLTDDQEIKKLKLDKEQFKSLLNHQDSKVTNWVFTHKDGIIFDKTETKNLFAVNPFFAAKVITEELISAEDFFDLVIDEEKSDYVNKLLSTKDDQLIQYIKNIYKFIEFHVSHEKLSAKLKDYQPAILPAQSAISPQASEKGPRVDVSKFEHCKDIIEYADKITDPLLLKTKQEYYFAAYTHENVGNEFYPNKKTNRRVGLGKQIIDSCFKNKNFDLLCRFHKERGVIKKKNLVFSDEVVEYLPQIDQHLAEQVSKMSHWVDVDIAIFLNEENRYLIDYIPSVDDKETMIDYLMASASSATLREHPELLAWVARFSNKGVKNLVNRSLASKELTVTELLRSPILTKMMGVSDMLAIIHKYPESEKILKHYKHLEELRKLHEAATKPKQAILTEPVKEASLLPPVAVAPAAAPQLTPTPPPLPSALASVASPQLKPSQPAFSAPAGVIPPPPPLPSLSAPAAIIPPPPPMPSSKTASSQSTLTPSLFTQPRKEDSVDQAVKISDKEIKRALTTLKAPPKATMGEGEKAAKPTASSQSIAEQAAARVGSLRKVGELPKSSASPAPTAPPKNELGSVLVSSLLSRRESIAGEKSSSQKADEVDEWNTKKPQ